ncbi:hypothetical protein [Lactobacillus sp.]|uniref:hypothetical protein n=1 Tax=Lactobacillus sp. TaxID=1591 RepID=UPI00198599B5|nr:hypothetical protein [Lactobacillus sp.]MBD5429344.1 hypothetical protein [Lactobacillus sp.]
MISPSLELRDAIFKHCMVQGYSVCTHLPLKNENAPYPFVVVGEQQTSNRPYKVMMGATLYQTIHVWGSDKQIKQVDEIMHDLTRLTFKGIKTANYKFAGRSNLVDNRILEDDSVEDTILEHGILTLSFSLQ